jgi:hypothetical protein
MRIANPHFKRCYAVFSGYIPVAKGGGIEPPAGLSRAPCALDIIKVGFALPEGSLLRGGGLV